MLKSFKLMGSHESTSHNAIQDSNDLRKLTAKIAEDYIKKHPKKSQSEFFLKYFISCESFDGNKKAGVIFNENVIVM